ncbi:MAG: dihydroneopterin aldolase / 2-amino-4-hydroxy-6-hydroxymethyldihydropteridine diphosphokinase [Frankiales bacterium]|nr:dihydroneopterin aldolase / 2-amino-4-hydroxy-6-hydroxymethyldihydropteridine diphosphokinase [Frankiales bacterium]MDX6245356.1 dihydroneopterin aldolase / 2-amino-4-hydroxy-6-hydroxymethyldihydropteridine diphosphokinase [Frankiales bacterium]
MSTVVFALGANLGNPYECLRRSLTLLAAHEEWALTAVSSVYVTDPVGGPEGQPPYLNAVGLAEVGFGPRTTLGLFHVVEEACGRVHDERWGPRTLDLDLIRFDDLTSADPSLTLPHPRAYERGFVVQPWLEVDPDAALPGIGRIDLLPAARPDAGVRRREDLVLAGPMGVLR